MAYKAHSRYRGSTVTSIETTDGLKNYTILKLPIEVSESEFDYFIEIDSTNEYRPDLLSYQVYEDPNYGWALMEINTMRSFLDMKPGVRMRIPPIENIEEAVKATHDRG